MRKSEFKMKFPRYWYLDLLLLILALWTSETLWRRVSPDPDSTFLKLVPTVVVVSSYMLVRRMLDRAKSKGPK